MNIQIRLAKEEDYNQVESIMQQVHVLHTNWRPDVYKPITPILLESMFLDHLNRNEVLVAVNEEDTVLGLLIYVTRIIFGGPMVERKVLFIDSMAVDEKYRGQGIGHKLFDYVRELCKEQNYDGLELQVNARNTAAKAMYEKYGFTEKSINMELRGF